MPKPVKPTNDSFESTINFNNFIEVIQNGVIRWLPPESELQLQSKSVKEEAIATQLQDVDRDFCSDFCVFVSAANVGAVKDLLAQCINLKRLVIYNGLLTCRTASRQDEVISQSDNLTNLLTNGLPLVGRFMDFQTLENVEQIKVEKITEAITDEITRKRLIRLCFCTVQDYICENLPGVLMDFVVNIRQSCPRLLELSIPFKSAKSFMCSWSYNCTKFHKVMENNADIMTTLITNLKYADGRVISRFLRDLANVKRLRELCLDINGKVSLDAELILDGSWIPLTKTIIITDFFSKIPIFTGTFRALSGMRISWARTVDLHRIMTCCPYLQTLVIGCLELNFASEMVLKEMPNLRFLTLMLGVLQDARVKLLQDVIELCPSLNTLYLNLEPRMCELFSGDLDDNSRFSNQANFELVLDGNRLSQLQDLRFWNFSPTFKATFASLSSLHLTKSNIPSVAVAENDYQLMLDGNVFPQLQTIKINGFSLAFKATFEKLSSLDLIQIDHLSLNAICAHCPYLTQLRIDSNKHDIVSSDDLVLPKMLKLKSIELKNCLGFRTRTFFNLVRSCPSLDKIHVEACNNMENNVVIVP